MVRDPQRSDRGMAHMHLACARARNGGTLPPRPLCKHWVRRGLCFYKSECFYLHPEDEKGSLLKQQKRKGNRIVVSNRNRARILRFFAVTRLGDHQHDRGFVLDVAGGKGEIGYIFQNVDGLQSAVIDPRPLQTDRFQKRLRRGIYHQNSVMRKTIARSHEESCRSPRDPLSLRILLTPALVKALGQFMSAKKCPPELATNTTKLDQAIREAVQAAKAFNWKDATHEDGALCDDDDDDHDGDGGDDGDDGELHEMEEFGEEEYIRNILVSSRLLIGMHPDQATEPLVDLALATDKAFAVVPCCVFPRDNSHRRLKDGTTVTTYQQFLTYLMEKHDHIKRDTLPFEGKNQVLYWSPHWTDGAK